MVSTDSTKDRLEGYEILRAWRDLGPEELGQRVEELKAAVEDPAISAATRSAVGLAIRSIYALRKMGP